MICVLQATLKPLMGTSSAVKSHSVSTMSLSVCTRGHDSSTSLLFSRRLFFDEVEWMKSFFFFLFKSAYSGETAARYRLRRKTLPVHKLVLPAGGDDLERRKRGNRFFFSEMLLLLGRWVIRADSERLYVLCFHTELHTDASFHCSFMQLRGRRSSVPLYYIYLYTKFTW